MRDRMYVRSRYNELGNLAIFLEHMVLFSVVTTVHQDGHLFADSIFCFPAFVRPSYAMYWMPVYILLTFTNVLILYFRQSVDVNESFSFDQDLWKKWIKRDLSELCIHN